MEARPTSGVAGGPTRPYNARVMRGVVTHIVDKSPHCFIVGAITLETNVAFRPLMLTSGKVKDFRYWTK